MKKRVSFSTYIINILQTPPKYLEMLDLIEYSDAYQNTHVEV